MYCVEDREFETIFGVMFRVLDIFFPERECFDRRDALESYLEVVYNLLELFVYGGQSCQEFFRELLKTLDECIKVETIYCTQCLLALMCPALLEELGEMEHSLRSQMIDVN